MGPRIRLGTDRPRALGRSSPAAPPPPEIDAECAPRSLSSVLHAPQPPRPPHPPVPQPISAQGRPHAPFARLTATLPLVARLCAGTQSCPFTSTRVEGGAPRRRSGEGLAQAGRGYALAPGGWPGATLGGRCGASKAVWPGVEKARLQWGDFSEAIYGQILGNRIAQLICRIT